MTAGVLFYFFFLKLPLPLKLWVGLCMIVRKAVAVRAQGISCEVDFSRLSTN